MSIISLFERITLDCVKDLTAQMLPYENYKWVWNDVSYEMVSILLLLSVLTGKHKDEFADTQWSCSGYFVHGHKWMVIMTLLRRRNSVLSKPDQVSKNKCLMLICIKYMGFITSILQSISYILWFLIKFCYQESSERMDAILLVAMHTEKLFYC